MKNLPRTLLLILAIGTAIIPLALVYASSNMAGWENWLNWVYAQQRAWQQSMSNALQGLATQNAAASAWTLITGSFIYGFVHAAGPGHGKVIMTTYLATNPEETRRGLFLTIIASLTQAVTAVVLVYGLLYIVEATTRDTRNAVSYAERASFVLVVIMGAWLIWRGIKSHIAHLSSNNHQHSHSYSHSHSHAHDHHDHHEHHEHDENCGCGHAHVPSIDELKATINWRTQLGIILSIGLRPCTGAVLVLILAKSLGLAWAGVLSAFTMAIGTAGAICILAFIAIKARDKASRLTSSQSSNLPHYLALALTSAGGLILILFGTALLIQGPLSGSALIR